MLAARSDQKVLGFLGRALSLELSAVQQLSTQARLVAAWGLDEAAESFKKEAAEEFEHADRIVGRMVAVGVAPNASQLRPVRLANDLSELLEINRQIEAEAVRLYQAATAHCAAVGDHDSRIFFESLLEEEQQHLSELNEWLTRIRQSSRQSILQPK